MLQPVDVSFGSDPEAFLERNGRIVGSEKVLPAHGLLRPSSYHRLVIQDGVQIEFNPLAIRNVLGLASSISEGFQLLQKHLAARHTDVSCCFRGVVEVSREELDSLGEKSRVLGCQPSRNFYGDKPITVDVKAYRKRSAGGHLHIGLANQWSTLFKQRERLVPLLDIFVGNTCVMLDRDPNAAERRENYGRAGEYRLPDHGLEYRTLSNFWLKNYALMSLAFGMAQVALSVLNVTLSGPDVEGELVDIVNIDNVARAIDTNSFDLARDNFERIVPFLMKHLPKTGFPLRPDTVAAFTRFAETVNKRGLDVYFPGPVVEHWINAQFVAFDTFLGRL